RVGRQGRGPGARPGHGPARRGPQPVAVLPRPPSRPVRPAGPTMSTILISGGTVVTAGGTLDADVLVAGERIAAVLARDLTGEPGAPPGGAPAAGACGRGSGPRPCGPGTCPASRARRRQTRQPTRRPIRSSTRPASTCCRSGST